MLPSVQLLIIHSVTALPVAKTSQSRTDTHPVQALLVFALAVAVIATVEAIRHHRSKTSRRLPPARPDAILPTQNFERTPHDTAYSAVLVAHR